MEEDLVSRGFQKVCLNVGRENIDARRLYDRNGYQIVGIEAGKWSYLDENGLRKQVHEPAWRMEKLLDGKQVNNGLALDAGWYFACMQRVIVLKSIRLVSGQYWSDEKWATPTFLLIMESDSRFTG